MAMGKSREEQEDLFVTHESLRTAGGHPFYDAGFRDECCSAGAHLQPCVLGKYGWVQRIFWDLHDGTDAEPWPPSGSSIGTKFDQIDGGGSVLFSSSNNHKLLDVMFGYLGGNKMPDNPDRADRGVAHTDIVDVLDGMMCRGHMVEIDAEELLHEVMGFQYDFSALWSCCNATVPCN